MDPSKLHDKVGEFEVLDVREPKEWNAGHIEGSRHIPMDQVAQRLDDIDSSRPVVTVCRSGARSGEVAEFLQGQGYDASNMDGGLKAWEAGGYPLTTPEGAEGRVA